MKRYAFYTFVFCLFVASIISSRFRHAAGDAALTGEGTSQGRVPKPHGDLPGRFGAPAPQRASEHGSARRARVETALGKLRLYFIENHGQLDARVGYYVQGRDSAVYFTPQGLTFALGATDRRLTAIGQPAQKDSVQPASLMTKGVRGTPTQRWVLNLDFLGANPGVKPIGKNPTPAVISYFKGARAQWKTGLPTYAMLVYADLWPGIDLVYAGSVNRLKYTFVVRPGADPNQIRLAYRGATAVGLNKAGQLEVSTPSGGFRDEKPYGYQEAEGKRVDVATAYSLETGVTQDGYVYGFRVGPYDKSQPLVLDPEVLIYCGYIGGSDRDEGQGIAVDTAGNAYVTGLTSSSFGESFPVEVGPDLDFNGPGIDFDAFVAKVSADGTELLYAGYIGGSDWDEGRGIAVDVAGSAYVTGRTGSDENSFPVAVGPDLSFNGGRDFFEEGIFSDAFVAKLNPDGTHLLYAGYIGGSFNDYGNGIAVDSFGSAYVVGHTQSDEIGDFLGPNPFPVRIGPDLTFNGLGADFDAFVAKVNSAGTALEYCGYIGGLSTDFGWGIAVDANRNAYVAGSTLSTEDTFPDGDPDNNNNFGGVVGPDQTHNGSHDVFVAKVSTDGTHLLYAGYIGGAGQDMGGLQPYGRGLGIAVDANNNACITGQTLSSQDTFPVKGGPGPRYNGGGDAFVAKVSADGTHLVYAGYMGGTNSDAGRGIAVDGAGNAYITGSTSSNNFPVKGGPDRTHNGDEDAFVAKLNPDGTVLIFSGYVGGAGDDAGRGIAVDAAGSAYITGLTDSDENSFPETVGPDLDHNLGKDTFVAKIAFVSPVPIDIDIRPNFFPNPINPTTRGLIPVAIPTTASFDAKSVNATETRFGATGTEAAPVHFDFKDVDGDGDIDIIFQFRTEDTRITCGMTSAALTGSTVSGQPIQGSDSIKTVACK